MKNWLKIISSKANPLFWPILFFLWIISLAYALVLMLHNLFTASKVQLTTPVLSIGNLTVGGSGKTPLTIWLAKYFMSKGKQVGIVSSGYGRKNIVDICAAGRDILKANIDDVGDEVKMMATVLEGAYFGISKTKSRAAGLLEKKYSPDLILIDDGFQHRRLYRNYDILLIDAGIDLRRESLFPLGRRREPLGAVSRADAVILTKTNMAETNNDFRQWVSQTFNHKPYAEVDFLNERAISKDSSIDLNKIVDKSIYIATGIGNFTPLLKYLEKTFTNIVGWRSFPDHCRYTRGDIDLINNDLDGVEADIFLTTHKDYVKLRDFDFGRPIYYLDLKLNFVSGEQNLLSALDKVVGS
jgi:tetraacyldisaccharide 4'-kinase